MLTEELDCLDVNVHLIEPGKVTVADNIISSSNCSLGVGNLFMKSEKQQYYYYVLENNSLFENIMLSFQM